jgi:hypothetical protein
MGHPTRHLAGWTGIRRVDVHGGYTGVSCAVRESAPVLRALCCGHARCKFLALADIKATARKGRKVAAEIAPITLEAVPRMGLVFEVGHELNSVTAAVRHETRQRIVRPMAHDLHDGMQAGRARMWKHNRVAKAINDMFEEADRWNALVVQRRLDPLDRFVFRFILGDGRSCLTHNTAKRVLRGVAIGRKAGLLADSPGGSERAAFTYSLIVEANVNDVGPHAWTADVVSHPPDMPALRLPDLLPRNCKARHLARAA